MQKLLIIDDEKNARNVIKNMLEVANVFFESIGEAEDVQSGIKAIKIQAPDIVLLDINLPDGSGFDILKSMGQIDFKVIFFTAYEEYAMKAFAFSAIDYLLKPVDPTKFVMAIKRAISQVDLEETSLKYEVLLSNLQKQNSGRKKLILSTEQKMYMVNINQIIYCQSDGSYTRFFLEEGDIFVSKNLKYYEELLKGCNFFRCHQTYLINVNFINYYDKKDGGVVVMKNNACLPLSQRKRESFYKLMRSL